MYRLAIRHVCFQFVGEGSRGQIGHRQDFYTPSLLLTRRHHSLRQHNIFVSLVRGLYHHVLQ